MSKIDSKKEKKVKKSASASDVKNKAKKRTFEKGEKKLKKVKSRVVEEEQEILERLNKRKETTNEDDHLAVYLDMYRKQRRIIRKLEKQCLKSKNAQGVYQLATLYSQLRETISDIRSLTDLSEHAENLIIKIIRPLFTSIVQEVSDSMYVVKLRLKDKIVDKKRKRSFNEIDDITVDLGKKLQQEYQKVCVDIKTLLTGEE